MGLAVVFKTIVYSNYQPITTAAAMRVLYTLVWTARFTSASLASFTAAASMSGTMGCVALMKWVLTMGERVRMWSDMALRTRNELGRGC